MCKRILVVEDDPDAALLVQITMEEKGYEVEIYGDGQDALYAIRQKVQEGQKIDLIVLDLYLPGLHGIKIAEELWEVPETKNIPIILVTVMAQSELQAECSKLGNVRYYFRKPANMGSIATAADQVVGSSSGGGITHG